MKQYILVCVNEEKEIVSTQVFATLSEAQEQMIKEHDSHLHEFEDDDDYIEDHSLGGHYAHIYYGTDLEYHWEISNIDIPDTVPSGSPEGVTIARNLFFIFRDDFENSSDTRRLALFKAIFGADMGEHIYATKWRDDRPYDFISSLDGDNIKKFADFLLDPYKYRDVAEKHSNN